MNKEMFDKGLAIRKSVIGAEFVDKALATADDFNMPLQELVTEYCWGAVWSRPGLDRRTRSIVNLAMLSAETGTGAVASRPCPTYGPRAGCTLCWLSDATKK